MTCKELSSSVVVIIITTVVVLALFSSSLYIDWLISDPIECVDGKLYEVTYEGNIKILDEQYGEICIVKDMK